MRAYASHHIQEGNEKYGNRVGEYVYYLPGADAVVYMHPCVLCRGEGRAYTACWQVTSSHSVCLIRGVVVAGPGRFSKFTLTAAGIVHVM